MKNCVDTKGYSEKHATLSMYGIVIIFYSTESYDTWMKACSWAVSVHVIFKWTHNSIWVPMTSWTHCKWTTKLSTVSCSISPVISLATVSIFACNSWIVCGLVEHMIFEVFPKETIAKIHIQWTWQQRPHTSEVLWKLIQQDTATKTHHAGHPWQHML